MSHLTPTGKPCERPDGHKGQHRPPGYRERQNEKQRARNATPEYHERAAARRNAPGFKERENARQREQYASNPEYRKRMLAKNSERHTARYASDPDYRESIRERQRKRRAAPECRERENTRRRERTATDPAYRDKTHASYGRWAAANPDKVFIRAQRSSETKRRRRIEEQFPEVAEAVQDVA